MIKRSIARRYAQALMDLVEKDAVETGRRLSYFVSLVSSNPDLKEVLANPGFSLQERRKVLSKLTAKLGWEPPLPRFVDLLVERHRVPYLEAIASVFEELVDQSQGRVRVEVASATGLDPKIQADLKKALVDNLGKQVILTEKVDADLVAGMAVRVGGLVVDGSFKNQLDRLKQSLLQERH